MTNSATGAVWRSVVHCSVAGLLWGLSIVSAHADARLASVFSDHMVLQREQPLKVWGWADAGEDVTVAVGDAVATTKADESGRWQVELAAQQASQKPVRFLVEARNRIELQDVLVGEVWLCSGQSNMEWTVAISADAQQEIAAANYPMIRHIKVPLVPSTVPLDAFDASWQVCSPETAGNFTACGYYMARKLHQELNVPIGLVNSSWGGTRIEPWTPPLGFQQVPALQDIYRSVIGRTPGTPEYRRRLAEHIAAVDAWLTEASAKLESTGGVGPSPGYPAELVPFGSNQDPAMLYNGMIHALVGFPIRGAIWYQGESNHTEGMLYLEKMKALIGGWRGLWNREFPFYFVQIAPYQYGSQDRTVLAQFWEAQAAAAKQIPRTGMVVINDIATVNDIHPPNKQDVGLRLAQLALRYDYGQNTLVADSPELERLEIRSDSLKLHLRNTAGGLKTRDGRAPTHFEIAGPGSGGFHPAKAEVQGDAIVLTSEKVLTPVTVRFAWDLLAEPNLTGGTGLSVGAFRAGELPTFLSSLPIADQYTLVYDLDLSRLKAEIAYDVDQHQQVQAFDRVGYLVELAAADGTMKNVFVSMKSFTDDVKKLAVPTRQSGAVFQQGVTELDIFSNVPELQTGTGVSSGQIEFWPHNYGMKNAAGVVGASEEIYDFGDEMAPPDEGYGSMQVHNLAAGQTIFAINNWRAGDRADIGIGPGPGNTPDWTFTANAGSWTSKRLRVYVRQVK